MTYVFDIDGTICTNTNGDYLTAKPLQDRIDIINKPLNFCNYGSLVTYK